MLQIPVGTQVRAAITITSGNAGNGLTVPDLDIDGNGVISVDEARVRSTGRDLGGTTLPSPTSSTTPVTLSDALADISTTGTVTFTNAVFTIGQMTGTVQLTYDGGDDGGTIGNCAHLTGTGINLETCSTQIIAPEPWEDGDVITYSQGAWGTTGTNASSLLLTNYNAVYPSTQLEVGIPGAGGNSILLTGYSFVAALLPTSGAIRALLVDEINLSSTTAGTFGGDVIALALNVDFSDAGVTLGALGIPFGNLKLCGVPSLPNLDNMTVREFLGLVSTLLGGGTGIYSIDQLAGVTDNLTDAFEGGVVSLFADLYLTAGTCN